MGKGCHTTGVGAGNQADAARARAWTCLAVGGNGRAGLCRCSLLFLLLSVLLLFPKCLCHVAPLIELHKKAVDITPWEIPFSLVPSQSSPSHVYSRTLRCMSMRTATTREICAQQ